MVTRLSLLKLVTLTHQDRTLTHRTAHQDSTNQTPHHTVLIVQIISWDEVVILNQVQDEEVIIAVEIVMIRISMELITVGEVVVEVEE